MTDPQQVIDEWMEAFKVLPEDRQDKLRMWFATQKLIIDHAGLTPEKWFGHIQWAMDNPLDYSFVNDFPDRGELGGEDSAERTDETRAARELVGGATKVSAPEGDAMPKKAQAEQGLERELFDRFMSGRLGGGGRK
jgi:hypothetical protein